MIKFEGLISGRAKKRCLFKHKLLGLFFVLCGLFAVLPTVIMYAIYAESIVLIVGCAIGSPVILLAVFLPQGKKHDESVIPNKIFIEDGYIVSVGEKFEASRKINLAKKLIDHGEFYEIIFPVGKVSPCFICQKDLLVNGTFEEFEALFEGKIVRKE